MKLNPSYCLTMQKIKMLIGEEKKKGCMARIPRGIARKPVSLGKSFLSPSSRTSNYQGKGYMSPGRLA